MMDHRYKEIARAVALGDSDTVRQLYRELNESETGEFHVYLSAVSAIFIATRLESDSSREAVDSLIDEVKRGFAALGDSLKPLALEAVVRATMGEDQLIHEVDAGDQVNAQMMIVRAITATVPKIEDNLDGYLTESEALIASELG